MFLTALSHRSKQLRPERWKPWQIWARALCAELASANRTQKDSTGPYQYSSSKAKVQKTKETSRQKSSSKTKNLRITHRFSEKKLSSYNGFTFLRCIALPDIWAGPIQSNPHLNGDEICEIQFISTSYYWPDWRHNFFWNFWFTGRSDWFGTFLTFTRCHSYTGWWRSHLTKF